MSRNDEWICICVKRLVEQKRKVRLCTERRRIRRMTAVGVFFSGDETEEYVNDPENIGIYDIQTITEIDPDVLPLLESPVGSMFEREEETEPFKVSRGFD